MPQFQYTAVNSNGKKLSGIIGAENEDDARKQLNVLGISVLGIEKTEEKMPVSKHAQEENLKKFEFEAMDKTGKKILGTIPASNRFKAFQRLIDEYEFEVLYLVPFGATDEEKEKARGQDLSVLKAETKSLSTDKKDIKASKKQIAFEKKRSELLGNVDTILDKIKEMLSTYQEDINPESKDKIEKYMDKLLRIKSSTNLDYIEHTSEELLKKIQDQELFMHKERMQNERERLKVETQKMMAELHQTPFAQKDFIGQFAETLENLKSSQNPLLKGMGMALSTWLPSPEMKNLKRRIQKSNRQLWTFRKMWLSASQSMKPEVKEGMDEVLTEKKRLKKEMSALKRIENVKRHQPKDKSMLEPLLFEEIKHFLGWLLTLYLIAFFAAYYLLAKALPGGNPFPGDFNLLQAPILRNLLISIFFWYSLLHVRVNFLRYQTWTNFLIIPLGTLVSASIIFNL